jgi:predicted lipoprotein with Yx(FWY)xxD motif
MARHEHTDRPGENKDMIARNTTRATRIGLSAIAGTLLAAGVAGGVAAPRGVAHAAAPAAARTQAIVATAQRPTFGKVLVNGQGFALYYWSKEKTGAVKCTGACARVWPPLLVASGARPPMHIPGAMGAFGVVMRPDGTRQLAFNHHPLYTFQGDKTTSQILCDGVDGWHVYRLGH